MADNANAEYLALAERIRAEANIADRPGQYERLNQIALDLVVMASPTESEYAAPASGVQPTVATDTGEKGGP